jgi:hypothetical protein
MAEISRLAIEQEIDKLYPQVEGNTIGRTSD